MLSESSGLQLQCPAVEALQLNTDPAEGQLRISMPVQLEGGRGARSSTRQMSL